jgi:hypothetical protein
VTNVILAGDDDNDDDDEEFLVEEKPKDDLDLKTETVAPDNEVQHNSAKTLYSPLQSFLTVVVDFMNQFWPKFIG